MITNNTIIDLCSIHQILERNFERPGRIVLIESNPLWLECENSKNLAFNSLAQTFQTINQKLLDLAKCFSHNFDITAFNRTRSALNTIFAWMDKEIDRSFDKFPVRYISNPNAPVLHTEITRYIHVKKQINEELDSINLSSPIKQMQHLLLPKHIQYLFNIKRNIKSFQFLSKEMQQDLSRFKVISKSINLFARPIYSLQMQEEEESNGKDSLGLSLHEITVSNSLCFTIQNKYNKLCSDYLLNNQAEINSKFQDIITPASNKLNIKHTEIQNIISSGKVDYSKIKSYMESVISKLNEMHVGLNEIKNRYTQLLPILNHGFKWPDQNSACKFQANAQKLVQDCFNLEANVIEYLRDANLDWERFFDTSAITNIPEDLTAKDRFKELLNCSKKLIIFCKKNKASPHKVALAFSTLTTLIWQLEHYKYNFNQLINKVSPLKSPLTSDAEAPAVFSSASKVSVERGLIEGEVGDEEIASAIAEEMDAADEGVAVNRKPIKKVNIAKTSGCLHESSEPELFKIATEHINDCQLKLETMDIEYCRDEINFYRPFLTKQYIFSIREQYIKLTKALPSLAVNDPYSDYQQPLLLKFDNLLFQGEIPINSADELVDICNLYSAYHSRLGDIYTSAAWLSRFLNALPSLEFPVLGELHPFG